MNDLNISAHIVMIRRKSRYQGSGFLFLPSVTSKYIYILTARHCLFAKKSKLGPIAADLTLYFEKEDRGINYPLSVDDEIIADEKEVPDLALLKLKRENIESITGELPVSYIVDFDAEYLSNWHFKGFPHFNAQKSVSDHVNIIPDDSNDQRLEVLSHATYSTSNSFSSENVKGFSGSALVRKINGQIYILGIVTDYRETGNRFIVASLSKWLKTKIEGLKIYNIGLETILPWDLFLENIKGRSEQLGPRYTPLLNIELDIASYFNTISHDQHLKNRLNDAIMPVNDAYAIFQSKFRSLYRSSNTIFGRFCAKHQQISYVEKGETFKDILDDVTRLIEEVNRKLGRGSTLENKVNTESLLRRLYDRTYGLSSIMYFLQKKIKTGKALYDDAFNACTFLNQRTEILLGKSRDLHLTNNPYLMISGEAGAGKSHLFADVANSRIKDNKPTLFFLGQNFTSGQEPWKQILAQLAVKDLTVTEFLHMLNEKGRLMGERVLILVDAINEGQGLGLWPNDLESFVAKLVAFPYIALAMSYRQTYVTVLRKNETAWNYFTPVVHEGFRGNEREALVAFSNYYNIDEPKVPVLSEEFSNPLFLRLMCLSLQKDSSLIRNGKVDISSIFSNYIEYVNEKLGQTEKYDYAYYKLNLVKRVTEKMANVMLTHNEIESLDYEKAFDLTQELVGKYLTKKRFLDDLINENVLIDEIRLSDDYFYTPIYRIAFAYQRLGDHFRAKEFIGNIRNKLKTHNQVFNRRVIRLFLKDEKTRLENQGLVNAALTLAIDRFSDKIYTELIPSDIRNEKSIINAVLHSFLWRQKTVAVNDLEEFYHLLLAENGDNLYAFWDTNLLMTFNLNQSLDALFLHKILSKMSMPDRDATWSIYINDRFYLEETGPVNRLIKWGLEFAEFTADHKSALMGLTALTWFLTSVNRELRDTATKSILNVLLHLPSQVVEWMSMFESINDPYITQRVYAVVFGVIVRQRDPELIVNISDYVYKNFFGLKEVIPDILKRDYASLILEFARKNVKNLSYDEARIAATFTSKIPKKLPSNKEIDNLLKGLEIKKYGGSDTIVRSMVTEYGRGTSAYGDFGRYVFESGLRAWKEADADGLSNLAVKYIFTKYGYDENKHGNFDNNIEKGRGRSYSQERIGKKYQWIAFFEILAKVADSYLNFNGKGELTNGTYKGAWNPYVRDIDPTFLTVPPKKMKLEWLPKIDSSKWLHENNRKWLESRDNIPDPTKFAEIIDSEGKQWLCLQIFPDWNSRNDEYDQSFHEKYKDFWMQIRSYIIKKESQANTINRLKKADLTGRWMPESSERHTMFHREYYWSPAMEDYKSEDEYQEIFYRRELLGKVSVSTINYFWDKEFDKSNEGTVNILKPSKLIYELLQLKDGDKDGEFVDSQGNLVCFDPSVQFGGRNQLIIDKEVLLKSLDQAGLDIFWAMHGEKRIMNDNFQPMEFYGVMGLDNETKELIQLNFNILNQKKKRKSFLNR